MALEDQVSVVPPKTPKCSPLVHRCDGVASNVTLNLFRGLYLCAYRVASAGLSTLSSVYLGLGPETQPQYHIPSADPYPQSRNPKPDPRPDRNEIPKSLKLNLWLHLNHASKKQHKLRIYASVLGARVGCF